MDPLVVVDVLRRARILYATERDLQDAVEDALSGAGLVVGREVSLNARSRIDFLVDDVGVECKINGAWRTVAQQLERYAAFDRIGSLVLVTTRNLHSNIPLSMSEKPILVHRIGSVL